MKKPNWISAWKRWARLGVAARNSDSKPWEQASHVKVLPVQRHGTSED